VEQNETRRTEKIIAISRLEPETTLEKMQPLFGDESAHAWEQYKAGTFREVYLRTDDQPGVVVVMECSGVEEARSILSDFPMFKAGLLTFELIPVGPFALWETLFDAGKVGTA
jgi:hypothetical protein